METAPTITSSSEDVPARLLWRGIAHLLDGVFVLLLVGVGWYFAATRISTALVPFVNTAFVVLYAVGCESTWGRTLGKRILRLRVRNQHGATPSIGQALRRNLYFALGLLPGFIGGLIALTVIGWIAAAILVDIDHRQGIHDRFASETFVTRRRHTRT